MPVPGISLKKAWQLLPLHLRESSAATLMSGCPAGEAMWGGEAQLSPGNPKTRERVKWLLSEATKVRVTSD